jgi:hypothetical protein
MFDDLDWEELAPTIALWIIFVILMQFFFNYFNSATKGDAMDFGTFKRILIAVLMFPVTYFIVNYWSNKD